MRRMRSARVKIRDFRQPVVIIITCGDGATPSPAARRRPRSQQQHRRRLASWRRRQRASPRGRSNRWNSRGTPVERVPRSLTVAGRHVSTTSSTQFHDARGVHQARGDGPDRRTQRHGERRRLGHGHRIQVEIGRTAGGRSGRRNHRRGWSVPALTLTVGSTTVKTTAATRLSRRHMRRVACRDRG